MFSICSYLVQPFSRWFTPMSDLLALCAGLVMLHLSPSKRWVQEVAKPDRKGIAIFEFTFPHNQSLPAKSVQIAQYALITAHIFRQLGFPEVSARLGHAPFGALCMAMPKAAMHEDRLTAGRKDEVGRARQASSMEPITVPKRMSESAHDHLNASVLRTHSCHQTATLGRNC